MRDTQDNESIEMKTPQPNKIGKRAFIKSLYMSSLGLISLPLCPRPNRISEQKDLIRICFGSCNLQYKSQSFWHQILKYRPDHWLFLGDNIYGNTRDIDILRKKYNELKSNRHYRFFRNQVPVEGIWDDHDFGEDGANRTYPLKEESQQAFLDFFDVAKNDPRREQEGIYYTKELHQGRVKLYFLDCRYFRDPKKGRKYTLLGESQWQWLEDEFSRSKAQVNIIVSPIGVLLNRLFVTEDWAEFPEEKDRLLELVAKYNLSGTFFLSGDKHFGAAIKRKWDRQGKRVRYYELQSSGLTHTPSKKLHRLIKLFYGKKNVVVEHNFATFDIDFSKKNPQMRWIVQSLQSSRKVQRLFTLGSDGLWRNEAT